MKSKIVDMKIIREEGGAIPIKVQTEETKLLPDKLRGQLNEKGFPFVFSDIDIAYGGDDTAIMYLGFEKKGELWGIAVFVFKDKGDKFLYVIHTPHVLRSEDVLFEEQYGMVIYDNLAELANNVVQHAKGSEELVKSKKKRNYKYVINNNFLWIGN